MASETARPGSADVAAKDMATDLDLEAAASLLACFSALTGMPCSIADLSGKILVTAGWQDVCTRFHRPHAVAGRRCIESDAQLAVDLVPGEFREHKCPNGLRDMASPLYLAGTLFGRVHVGQFLYEDEHPDVDFFAALAEEYGFDVDDYLASIRLVPRYTRERARFLVKRLTDIVEVVSRLSVANRELEASEGRYRELYERTPIGYQSLDIDGRFLQVNQAWLDMLGYSREEVIGHWFGEFLAPGMVDLFLERFPRFVAVGKTSTEFDMRRKDGEIVTVAFDGRIGYGEHGEFRATHCVLANVTERKRAEEVLRLTGFAVDHAADCFYWITPEGRFIYVNDAACERLGYSREELLDMHVWDIAVDMLPEERTERWESLKQQGSQTIERKHRTKSGEVFPVEITANYFSYRGREFNFALARDITDRKRAEEETRNLRDFYELILTRINDGIWVTDKNDRLVYVNPGMEHIAGVGAADLLGLDVTRDFAPETTGAFLDYYLEAKREGVPRPYETEVVTLTGRFTVQSGWLIPRLEGGEYGGMICTIQDVTERRQAEDDLRESEERYRKLFELESDAIVLVDNGTGRILEVNAAAVDLYGYTHDEWLSMSHPDILAEPDHTRAAPTGETEIPLRWHKKKDGTVFPTEITAAHLDWKGRSVHIAAIRDITQRVEAELGLRQRDEQLRQSQKMEAVGQLAGGIAHDFNNLLTAILGYSDIVLSDPGLTNTGVMEDVAEIKRAAERASALTRQILAFSRRQALQPALVSLNEIVIGMESLLRRTLGEDISLVTLLDPQLGWTEVDVHQFEQVIMNLALNARDAMPSGGRLILETGNVDLDEHYCLTHTDVGPGRYVRLTVTDTGVGMGPETTVRMFEPFFTTKGPGEGTGLGLSTVYGIVRQSGGTIEVESELGGGSSFKVLLPLVDKKATGEPAQRAAAVGLVDGHETILVVEDEPALRSLISRVLRGLGYDVMVAADAAEALELVRERNGGIDLLITDVVLPGGMQGNDLVRSVLASYPWLPVLYMSGYTRDAIVHAGRLDDGVNFLEKPFSPATLVETVRTVLAEGAGRSDTEN